MKELLIKLNACPPAIDWAGDKSWEEIYKTCHRGDWLLWLFEEVNPADVRLRVLVAGHCANTVRHLMKHQISRDAVDGAIAFGEGKIDEDTLDKLARAARAARAYYAHYAAYYAAAATATAANAATATAANASDNPEANQLETANIVRKLIPIEKFNIDLK